MNVINTTRKELEALVKLIRHQGQLSEMYVGHEVLEITRACPDWYDDCNDPIWKAALEAGALVRIGYILGQRAERHSCLQANAKACLLLLLANKYILIYLCKPNSGNLPPCVRCTAFYSLIGKITPIRQSGLRPPFLGLFFAVSVRSVLLP